MAYDEQLAERIRAGLARTPGIAERKMFGGLCFTHNGNMVVGIVKSDLMARVGADNHADALAQPHARPMDFNGRPMKGMVYVGPAGIGTEKALAAWIKRCVDFTSSLPPK
jgi:TfoX/Sxy family transcriptional regulator of competence genes